MTLEQLRVFVCVAECEHMTRAAETLNLTQSATSAAIAALEERHGVKLFDRIGRRIALTGAGRAFLIEARAVLARAATAEQTLADLAGLNTGELILAASQTIGSYWLPARIAQFRAAYPGVMIKLRIGNTRKVAALASAGDVDLAFAEGEVSDPGLAVSPIGGDVLVIVAAPKARGLLDGLDVELDDGGALGGARKGIGYALRFRSGADSVRRRCRKKTFRAGVALERSDPRRSRSWRGTRYHVASCRRRLDQGRFADRFAASPTAPRLLPPASQAALRVAGFARLLGSDRELRRDCQRKRCRRAVTPSRPAMGRGFGSRSNAQCAGRARSRSVQMITANCAAPIKTAIERFTPLQSE